MCETVCRAWGAALSCMPKGTWGQLIVTISGDSDLRGGLVRDSGRAGPCGATVVLIESDLPYKEPGASFVHWLCRRAVGVNRVILEMATVKTGWLLPHLLLSLSNGGWQSAERPPIKLTTGRHTELGRHQIIHSAQGVPNCTA